MLDIKRQQLKRFTIRVELLCLSALILVTASCSEAEKPQSRSIAELRQGLRSGNPRIRTDALKGLSEYGGNAREALDDMIPLLMDSDFSVALSAQLPVLSVGGRTPCVGEAFERALAEVVRDDAGKHVVLKAGIYTILKRENLEEFGVKQAVRDAGDQDVNFRKCAEGILKVAVARADQRTIKVLTAMLSESQPESVLLRIIACLSELGPKARGAIPPLQRLAKTEHGEEVLSAAQKAVISILSGDSEKHVKPNPVPIPYGPVTVPDL